MEEKNMKEIMEKAEVLIEALPYIQRFNRKIIVVKYGGSAMVDEELKKKEQVILLMDCYRELLTDKQKQYLTLYYEEDLSLSEIAEDLGVSKNAVFDNIKRSVMSLEKYESKLHILENHRKRLDLINKIEEEKNKKHEDIDEYLEMLKNI